MIDQYTPYDLSSSVLHVIELLKNYDNNLEKGIVPDHNPYNDKIVVRMEDGRIIEIPYDVQQEAIKKWEVMKNDILYDNEKKKLENEILMLSNTINKINMENRRKKSRDLKNKERGLSIFEFILRTLILFTMTFIIIYFIKCLKKYIK